MMNNDASGVWSCPCGASSPDDCGRWETNEDANGYRWIPEYHAPVVSPHDHIYRAAKPQSQCYCSGNDSMCDECHGTGAVRCG